jgi:ATP-dependent Lon protease
MTIALRQVAEYLGVPRYEREELDERVAAPGVATGLVWTPVGGDIVFIEATAMSVPGGRSSQLTITGQLGDVMQESAQAALSYVRAHADDLGAKAGFFAQHDLHIHVPAGATPKDGPSAGVAMCVALASLFCDIPVTPRVAMTGELTLTGKVLPVGGIKEKVLAAHRAGVRAVVLPKRNEKDLREDVPDDVREALTIYPVSDVGEALRIALGVPAADGRRQRRARRTTGASVPL